MSERDRNGNGQSSHPVPTCDSAPNRSQDLSSGGRTGLVNESYRNYSEVDRDPPPPPPSDN